MYTNAVQDKATQRNTIQANAIQYNTVKYNTMLMFIFNDKLQLNRNNLSVRCGKLHYWHLFDRLLR